MSTFFPSLRVLAALSLIVLPASFAAGQTPNKDLAHHPFFKLITGSWTAEGTLTGENNNLVTIKEEWTGKAESDASFVISGTREINADKQSFVWTITHNPAADTYEAVLTNPNDSSSVIRFEGSVSDVTLSMELKAITGGGNSSITVHDSFATDAHDTLESKVTFIGDQGQTTLEGTIKHKHVKKT